MGAPPAEVIAALEAAVLASQGRREGREVRFLCPLHDDHDPSARWNKGKLTWYCDVCQRGGGWIDLCQLLGVTLPKPATAHGKEELVAEYGYTDADGKLLYQVLRYSPKAFRQRRPDPTGRNGWTWNLEGVERVLYRLPKVLEAIEDGKRIYLVEGEKDADNVTALGLPATTNAGGAGKWRSAYAESLRGASVAILPDNDDAGRKHASAVSKALSGIAAEVRIVTLPEVGPKGDVSDWIAARKAAGCTPDQICEELAQLAEQSPLIDAVATSPVSDNGAPSSRVSRVKRLSEVEAEHVEFLWRPYIPLGKLTVLEGDPGQGKSTLALAIVASGSLGNGLHGMEAFEPWSSLIFTAEDGLADTIRPRLEAMGADCSRIFAHPEPIDLSSPEGFSELEREIADKRPRLVVIDPIVAYVGGRTDTYRANEVRAILAPLVGLAQRYNCAILIVRHLTKARGGRSIHAGQGSVDFAAAARSVLLVGSAPNDAMQRAMVHIKCNVAPLGPALGFSIRDGRFGWTGESALTAADVLAPESTRGEHSAQAEARTFLRELLADGPCAVRVVQEEAKQASITERTLRRAKGRMGVIARKQGFGAEGAWIWELPVTAKAAK